MSPILHIASYFSSHIKGGIFIDENTTFISESTVYLSITHNPFIKQADLIIIPLCSLLLFA